ncbi:uncharacterized protein LOC120008837 [Tripterygium wilfordii]|uniref:uncharacterized protein LOC120008837 n=1 Tax=Tripterygium wilfordii TaxID=458696 RepID=UPI0018F8620A|nr:uncharacterized protein LOC120008837 [Tripterygium wilfordii]
MVWRACNNCIPTKDLLHYRRIDIDLQCPVCNGAAESVTHVFIQCPMAAGCWRSSIIGLGGDTASNLVDWISGVFHNSFLDLVHLVCMVLWGLWRNRNEIVWNNKRQTVSQVLNLASSFLFQWQSAQVLPNDDQLPLMDEGVVCWQKPSVGWLKCNVDGALFQAQNKLGFGWVLRDGLGQMQAAGSGALRGFLDAGLAEALSFREALRWLKDNVISNVIIESDALIIVQAMKSSCLDSSYIDVIIDECKSLLKEINNYRICFVRRSANSVAHLLARAASSLTGVHVCWSFSSNVFALLTASFPKIKPLAKAAGGSLWHLVFFSQSYGGRQMERKQGFFSALKGEVVSTHQTSCRHVQRSEQLIERSRNLRAAEARRWRRVRTVMTAEIQ